MYHISSHHMIELTLAIYPERRLISHISRLNRIHDMIRFVLSIDWVSNCVGKRAKSAGVVD